jgi:hypothetical protein
MAIHSNDKFISALVKTLGLPKETVAFCLRAEVGRFVEVECTCRYYPNPENYEHVLQTERFTLERIENQEPTE